MVSGLVVLLLMIQNMVLSMDESTICNKIPGLVPEQRKLCRSYPDAMATIGDGISLALNECRFQFRNNRWNCSISQNDESLQLISDANRETAFVFAIRSAGVTYAITKACNQGNLSNCGCDQDSKEIKTKWKWGGCSANINYGLIFSRAFLDAQERKTENSQALMNLHNNRAGRKALKENMRKNCKCNGVSGSCTMKTCWTSLPSFRVVGDHLTISYERVKLVEPIRGLRSLSPIFLKLKRSANSQKKPPWKQLVYLNKSPDYCEKNALTGTLGTRGRNCNRTSSGCSRGFDARIEIRRKQCDCRFHWCCYVTCQVCTEMFEECFCR